MLDSEQTNLQKFFPLVFKFIDKARSDGGRVFVHCFAGLSRSATIVIAYLMKDKALTFAAAYDFVNARRCIQPNEGFRRQLRKFETNLLMQGHLSTNL